MIPLIFVFISPMVQTHTNTEMLFRRWQHVNISRSLAAQELQASGLSAEEINTLWEAYVQYRLGRRNTLGWSLIGIGGVLGFFSCVFTMLDLLPEFRGFLMYGLTSIAVTVALYGCYLVMEKPAEEEY